MSKPVKQSVALAIFDELGRLLVVQRPEDDEDLPNAWGLPASSLRAGESWVDAIQRTGREKLGVEVQQLRELQRGSVQRSKYELEMRLYEAAITSGEISVPQTAAQITQYQNSQWGNAKLLEPAAQRGSLCCRLYLSWCARPE